MADVMLKERAVLASSVFTGDNMVFMQADLDKKAQLHPAKLRLEQSLRPEWYELPSLK